MKKTLIIFGNKSTSLEIYEIVVEHFPEYDECRMVYFSENFIEEEDLAEQLDDPNHSLEYIIGFADYELRLKCEKAVESAGGFSAATIINPSAYVARSARIGKGCYIAANATVSSQSVLADHTIINYNVSVGHDAVIGRHTSINPGARISGNVKIGEGCLVGANAFIFQNIEIGNENMIDAMTYIRRSLPEKMISFSRTTKTMKRMR